MNSPSLKRAALAVLLGLAVCLPFILRRGDEKAAATLTAAPPPAQKPAAPDPSLPAPLPAKARTPPAPALEPQAEAETYVAGHFPGVSVRHLPGTDQPTPPEGTPRTPAKVSEVVLPDGQTLIGASVDESWRIPLKAEAKP
ncbi:hypothetical protein [Haloferula sp. BvORR071]|uniref:hypothetical protein n=1 Tax=Haloferula sp. BvORR071 TaxID=1396141 RepID=UPI000551C44E|nr:hypothetical protein [Haloferula sp. BvORR071]